MSHFPWENFASTYKHITVTLRFPLKRPLIVLFVKGHMVPFLEFFPSYLFTGKADKTTSSRALWYFTDAQFISEFYELTHKHGTITKVSHHCPFSFGKEWRVRFTLRFSRIRIRERTEGNFIRRQLENSVQIAKENSSPLRNLQHQCNIWSIKSSFSHIVDIFVFLDIW